MPDINGLELLKPSERAQFGIITSNNGFRFNDVDSISKCIQLGAYNYLPKPINGTILLAKLVAALERKFLREREKELVNELHIQATTDQLTGISKQESYF